MDPIRFGLAIRVLRRRRGWTQAMLGERCRLSQSTISDIEAGLAFASTVDTLSRVVAALGVRIQIRVLGHGEDLDRLLDSGHAEIVERVAAYLRAKGWEVVPEATFSVFGERGSVDLLAFNPVTGALLIVEVKSAIPDVQATLAGIDRKARLGGVLARERGWSVTSVSRWLVVPGDMTTRRRIAAHEITFRAALPGRTSEMKRWACAPRGCVAGIVFVSPTGEGGTRHRVGRRMTR
ncbi:MAG: helix-turn-helix domain-containing protein [Candidatus Limnocylindrales bacterium]